MVVELNTENFNETISTGLVLVDIWAQWCGPCKIMLPTVDQLGVDFEGRATICKLDADSNSESVKELGVRSIPTFIVYKDGEEVNRFNGVKSKQEITDRKSTRLNSSHSQQSRMPSSA